jgi:hypothetical protein
MNLREQLRHLLPQCLPADPAEAIKGTELIRLIRLRLDGDYSDATLRYHFSVLSYDPGSPIAKVDQGQGYYLRQGRRGMPQAESLQGWFDQVDDEAAAAWLRLDRVIAIYERLCLARSAYPLALNGIASHPPTLEGNWDLADVVVAEWDLAEADAEPGPAAQPPGHRLDEQMLRLRRHLGVPETVITALQARMGTSLETLSADFFQALSATRWASQSELLLAEPLTDGALVDGLRGLAHEFGVGVVILGIDSAALDALPLPDDIRAMDEARFDAVQNRLRPQRLASPATRANLNWALLSRLREKHPALQHMIAWLNDSLTSGRPTWRRPRESA